MAPQRRTRQHETQLAFEAISIEGGLLAPEWLSRVSQLSAGNQTEADYRVPKGINLRDELGRHWRIAQAHWSDFAAGRKAGADPDKLVQRFVPALLREAFGFGSLAPCAPIELGGRSFPIGQSALGGRVPVVLSPGGAGLDEARAELGDGGRRRSAFGLAQEYLNAADGSLWGLATDGLTLRILRDNNSLTRPAWVEASLERIFTEERYADFTALWLLAHETRFGRPEQPVTECALEVWRNAGREEGTRAREHLRQGVEEALVAFGQGFLAHPENAALRAALQDGTLSRNAYFQQLLRLVYRLIFLLTAEERSVLHPADAPEAARRLYEDGYGLARLRQRSIRRSAHDRYSDLWESVRIVFRGLAGGEARLGLPALAGIFHAGQCASLDGAKLENRALLAGLFKLTWLREKSGLSRVNWRDMGPEELGSVYEGLLELVPQIGQGARQFSFATGGETKGNARKLTGSYYTPDSLVQVLLDSALEPVVKETVAAHPEDPVEALLSLSVVDPACGSGHFLLAAARRLAAHVARLQASGTPSAAEYRHALRQVVGRCIYGVDLNPMAVELCKVSLWMEAVEPGRPLSFLDSHVRHGNALLGTTPELMAKGIPDAAFEPIEGDDRKIASALKKRNKAEAKQLGFEGFHAKEAESESAAVGQAVAELEASSDADPEALAKKASRWVQLQLSDSYRHQKFVADAWCAAFVWPKQSKELADAAPTNQLWGQLREGKGGVPQLTRETVEELAGQYRFFHWHLAFPQVFGRGGFDVVLGNPPWERVKLQEQEFFALRNEEIANATNAAERKQRIASLSETNSSQWREWIAASRGAEAQGLLLHNSGRFPLCATGDLNTYAVFAEHNLSLTGNKGFAGFITPTGLVTDDSTSGFLDFAMRRGRLRVVSDFVNGREFFPSIHASFRFSLVLLGPPREGETALVDLGFFLSSVAEALDPERRLRLSLADVHLLNPVTGTLTSFRTPRDARISVDTHRRIFRFGNHKDTSNRNHWSARIPQGTFHQTNDAEILKRREQLLAKGATEQRLGMFAVDGEPYCRLYEGRLVGTYDHRASSAGINPENTFRSGTSIEISDEERSDPELVSTPRFWVSVREAECRIPKHFVAKWIVVFKDVTASTNERTMIASAIPRGGVVYSLRAVFLRDASAGDATCLLACLNSHVLDFICRQKTAGNHVTDYIFRQLPIIPPSDFDRSAAWDSSRSMCAWILPRVLELTYTAWDLEAFAKDIDCDSPPFRWDPERRFLLRAELDAAFFHLYGISREDADYILETFPIVRKNDEKAHGEYRTKRVILETYDAMAEAARTGKPYQTRLDPPPADPRVAHPDRNPIGQPA